MLHLIISNNYLLNILFDLEIDQFHDELILDRNELTYVQLDKKLMDLYITYNPHD